MVKSEPFDEYSRRYEKWFDSHKHVYLSELNAVEEMIPSEAKGMEIGVGSGRFSAPLDIELGIDPSKDMLKLARQKGIEPVLGQGENLPFRDNSLDFVLIVTTICFFDEPKTAIEEASRVLKEEGDIIIGFIDKDSPVGEIYQQKKEENVFYKNAEFFNVEEVLQILERSGFEDFSFVQTIFEGLDISKKEDIKEGYVEGSFVVIKGKNIIKK